MATACGSSCRAEPSISGNNREDVLSESIWFLSATAASVALFHTVLGPDHYLPFIVMGRSRRWSCARTAFITGVCGVGHVLSSVALGLLGISIGLAVEQLAYFESVRDRWAAWALIAFGATYAVYGIVRAAKNRPHTHKHVHGSGSVHSHEHTHHEEHAHLHHESALASPVPWALFVIFVMGPCGPLIPLLMYPAANHSIAGVVIVASVFSIVTIGTMLGVVLVGTFGMSFAPLKRAARYSHAIAGCVILACGLAVQFLGL